MTSIFRLSFQSAIALATCGVLCSLGAESSGAGPWISLFNGRDLTGWTPKFMGHELGDNWKNVFRAEDGMIKVVYDGYGPFDGKFGHLFHKDRFTNYLLRVEYRFVGQQVPGGPGWALRNSGIMLHSQDPKTMEKDQDFPASLEVQLLGGSGSGTRHTANLCTPSTHVVMEGKLVTQHCIDSSSKTYHGDQWVTAEVEVHGGTLIKHLVEGETVMTYGAPQYDEGDKYGAKLAKVSGKMIRDGWICLQAESHPVEFRKVEVKILPE